MNFFGAFLGSIVVCIYSRSKKNNKKTCFKTFPPKTILSIIDFAKNNMFLDFSEVQKMHWHSFQLTILVHIYYRCNLNYSLKNPNSDAKKLIIEYNYYIFNDIEHKMLFVQHLL
jgi:hypothetical protein